MGRHSREDEIARRGRRAIIDIGKRPKLTKSDTDEYEKIKPRPMKGK